MTFLFDRLISRLPAKMCTFVIAFLGASTPLVAGQPVYVGRDVPNADRQALTEKTHAVWDRLLKKYVNEAGMVNYRAWQQSSEDSRALDQYLNQLSAMRWKEGKKEAQLAYWINAYNAVTVKGILREYPTTSIRNHTARLVGYNIWKDLKLRVEGGAISLDDMEHQVLRKMGEPRIHFAIVCASIGCPRLLAEAYTPDKLEQQLTVNTEQFFSDAGKFQANTSQGKVSLSPILKWFSEDFGKTEGERLAFVAKYAPAASRELLRSGQARIAYLDYDWGLNSQPQ